jgi:putative hydrolase of the HAD superfamily
LFDADGVIQTTPPEFMQAIHGLVDNTADAAAFVSEIFLAERGTLTGETDFPSALGGVLQRWRVAASLDEALQIWSLIHPLPGISGLISSLAPPCYLASNQQRHRGEYMSRVLGYGALFDGEFYSYRLGVMKPESDYFLRIVEHLGCAPEALLFIDDHESNVEAARGIGMQGVQFDLRQHEDALGALSSVLSQHGAF